MDGADLPQLLGSRPVQISTFLQGRQHTPWLDEATRSAPNHAPAVFRATTSVRSSTKRHRRRDRHDMANQLVARVDFEPSSRPEYQEIEKRVGRRPYNGQRSRAAAH